MSAGYVRATTIAEAVAARASHPDWTIICGATDLMVEAPLRPAPVGLIDVWGCGELCGIKELDDGGAVQIGAATPWTDVIASPLVGAKWPILVAAAKEIGALQIQARGTVGGNVGTSSPVGDSLPVLLALDAVIELRSPRGARTLPYRDYPIAYRKTALAADEIIVAVRLPAPHAGAKQHWRKVGTRRAQSISKIMAAAVLRVEGGTFVEARVGLGAVADRPVRAPAVEAAIVGQPVGAATADAAAAAVAVDVKPISDVRSTADYRMATMQHVIRRFVIETA